MYLGNLDSGKRSVCFVGNRSGRVVKLVRDELFGVVFVDSYDVILFVVSFYFENINDVKFIFGWLR